MNKLEKLHLKSIESVFDDTNSLEMAEKSAEITTDVAIKFAKWLGDKTFYKNTWFDENNHSLDETTTQDLFEEFINNHYDK
jgi:hypothetical protein